MSSTGVMPIPCPHFKITIHDTFMKKNFKLTKDAYLEKFLRAQGETLVRSGKEYRWKAHDSLTVCGNKWFRHSQSKGGMY